MPYILMPVDGKIQCRTCKEWKPLEQMKTCAKARLGVVSMCKRCVVKALREHEKKKLAEKKIVASRGLTNLLCIKILNILNSPTP